jgi:hypothetical protein
MERGNAKHSAREDDRLTAEMAGQLGPHGSNREEWLEAEPPADDDAPERQGPPVEELALDGTEAPAPQDERVQHDMDVANDWHR